jgi:hypothetical protein
MSSPRGQSGGDIEREINAPLSESELIYAQVLVVQRTIIVLEIAGMPNQ